MSRRTIGLDNPTFRGNVRTYRRRPVERPQRRQTTQYALLDDIQNQPQIDTNQPTSKKIEVKISNSVAKKPTWQTSQVGVEFVGVIPTKTTKRLSRSERFAIWQEQQRDQMAIRSDETPKQDEYLQTIEGVTETDHLIEEKILATHEQQDPDNQIVLREKKFKLKNLLTLRFALPAMATVIFFVGCGVAIQGVLTNRHVKAQVEEISNSASGYDASGQSDIPDETKPDESSGPYVVAADLPKYIRVNKIDIFARILRVGVKPNNELVAPNNIHNVGWYDGSAKPGSNGTALLDAHVHGPTMPGAFYNIHKLTEGDTIEIEMGDGRKFNYTVVSSETKPSQEVDMSKAMKSIVKGKNGLNLITCGGQYNRDTNSYEERVVVYAIQK